MTVSGAGRRVLLIEDEPNIVEAIRFVLSRDGWAVSTHHDGATALDAVRDRRPDVVVLDIMLPGMSGLDVLTALRADPSTTSIPILMLTARGRREDRETSLRLGADRFMTKPFAIDDMLDAVRALAGAPRPAAS